MGTHHACLGQKQEVHFRERHREFISFKMEETEGEQRNFITNINPWSPPPQSTRSSIKVPTWTSPKRSWLCLVKSLLFATLSLLCLSYLSKRPPRKSLVGIQRPNPKLTQCSQLSGVVIVPLFNFLPLEIIYRFYYYGLLLCVKNILRRDSRFVFLMCLFRDTHISKNKFKFLKNIQLEF